MQRSEQIGDLAAALAAFHAEAQNPPAEKTATVKSKKGEASSFNYRYADLSQIIEQVRTPLAANGLSVIQEIRVDVGNGLVGAATFVFHSSGQWLEFDPLWIPAGGEAKEYGIATTYSRRYSLMAALNLAPADDGTPNTTLRANAHQLERLHEARATAAVTDEQYLQQMKTYYGTTVESQLTPAQCSELIGALKRAPQRRPAAEDRGPQEPGFLSGPDGLEPEPEEAEEAEGQQAFGD